MPPGDVALALDAAERANQLQALRRHLETTNVQTMRQAARQWGWTLKGTAKAELIDQMAGYLSDSQRMSVAIQKLPVEELEVLTWLSAVGSSNNPPKLLQTALAEGVGRQSTQKAIGQLMQKLIERCLIFFQEYHGYQIPGIYNEWLPPVEAPKLLYAGRQEVHRPSILTVAEVTQHAQHLLAALGSEQPMATLAQRETPRYDPRMKTPALNVLRPSLVAADTLSRWGYATAPDQQMARFLLEQMANAGLFQVAEHAGHKQLHPVAQAAGAWEMATAVERLRRLRQAYLTPPQSGQIGLASWGEIDLALTLASGYSLQAITYWANIDNLLRQVILTRLWLSGLVARLRADTWYGIDQLQKLVYQLHRDPLAWDAGAASWVWVADDKGPLPIADQMPFDIWQKTHGRVVEAWLTGPARWLLFIQVSYAGDRPIAFQRPSVLPAGSSLPPPPNALRFMPGGTAVLVNHWRASDLRRLLQRIGVEISRGAETTMFRLDPDAFRQSLQSGSAGRAAGIAEEFAAAGFPLPPAVQETLAVWQSRAGRYQLYDRLAVLEFGEDVLPEEMRAITSLNSAEYYQVSPRCLVFLDPQVVPGLVEELRRRGYTPQVLP